MLYCTVQGIPPNPLAAPRTKQEQTHPYRRTEPERDHKYRKVSTLDVYYVITN